MIEKITHLWRKNLYINIPVREYFVIIIPYEINIIPYGIIIFTQDEKMIEYYRAGLFMIVINEVKELGVLIRDARKEQKLTQSQLCALCGVGLRFIVDIERGKPTCEFGKALHVIRMLGLDIAIRKRGEK